MAQAMQDARYAAISHDDRVITINRLFDGGWYSLIPILIVVATLVIGVSYFRKEAKYFAENI
jgi:hypothetical protein